MTATVRARVCECTVLTCVHHIERKRRTKREEWDLLMGLENKNEKAPSIQYNKNRAQYRNRILKSSQNLKQCLMVRLKYRSPSTNQ